MVLALTLEGAIAFDENDGERAETKAILETRPPASPLLQHRDLELDGPTFDEIEDAYVPPRRVVRLHGEES